MQKCFLLVVWTHISEIRIGQGLIHFEKTKLRWKKFLHFLMQMLTTEAAQAEIINKDFISRGTVLLLPSFDQSANVFHNIPLENTSRENCLWLWLFLSNSWLSESVEVTNSELSSVSSICKQVNSMDLSLHHCAVDGWFFQPYCPLFLLFMHVLYEVHVLTNHML